MIPLDDWMELKLYDKQAAQLDVRIAIPETVDRENDDSAAFEIIKVGPSVSKVSVGQVIILYGYSSLGKGRLPSGRKVLMARECDVCFVLEKDDLS